jgi:Zn-dependent peptidase ImmA (M78 family)
MKITKDRQIEQEANYFAMCLLMPDFLVKIAIGKFKDNIDFLKSAIKYLNV